LNGLRRDIVLYFRPRTTLDSGVSGTILHVLAVNHVEC
jgi:hypothetical protein